MEAKITRAVQCLYAVAAVQALSLIHSILAMIEIRNSSGVGPISAANPLGLITPAYAWPVAIVILVAVVAQNLKKKNEWGWIGALSLFLFTLPSFAFVFSVLGILLLIAEDVRAVFLERLQIKL